MCRKLYPKGLFPLFSGKNVKVLDLLLFLKYETYLKFSRFRLYFSNTYKTNRRLCLISASNDKKSLLWRGYIRFANYDDYN